MKFTLKKILVGATGALFALSVIIMMAVPLVSVSDGTDTIKMSLFQIMGSANDSTDILNFIHAPMLALLYKGGSSPDAQAVEATQKAADAYASFLRAFGGLLAAIGFGGVVASLCAPLIRTEKGTRKLVKVFVILGCIFGTLLALFSLIHTGLWIGAAMDSNGNLPSGVTFNPVAAGTLSLLVTALVVYCVVPNVVPDKKFYREEAAPVEEKPAEEKPEEPKAE